MTSTGRTRLERSIEEFILSRTKDFHFSDILEDSAVTKNSGFSEKAVLDILENSGLVFSRDFNTFKPRHIFFRNARFIVSPTEEETKNRMLIPGHRFLPFCSPLVTPWNCTLLSPEQTAVPKKKIQRNLESLFIYYTLFGRENMPLLLMLDQESNEKALIQKDIPASFPIVVTAFDFSALFKQWNFTFGDGMILEVRDWTHGVFTLEHITKRRRRELMETSRDWIARLEKGFLKTFDDLGLGFSLEEQIAYAYYYAGPQILKEPSLHLGGFIDSSSKVNFVSIGTESKLWRDHINASDLPALAPPKGLSGSLNAIFEDLNIPLTETEVEAYMRDELFRRKENSDVVMKRIFTDRSIHFFSDDQMNDFIRYFKKLWKRVTRSYNYFADQLAGKIRGRILEILDQHFAWLRNLDTREIAEEDWPLQELAGINQTVGILVEQLELLNQKSAGHEEEIRESLELLTQIEDVLEELRQEVIDKLESLPEPSEEARRNIRLVRPEPEEESAAKKTDSVYVLRISIAYISPQIWRNFQVPGSFSLEDLHDVIQTVMGWENYHLHSFTIGGKIYGPYKEEAFDMGIEQENEAEYTLDDLDLKEKQKFQYTYDFGDDWLHQITVSKILSAVGSSPEERRYPLCLGGKRACPPEDCGGISGHAEIMEALAASNKKKYRELLEWLGDYDPEFFDAETVNKTLRKRF